MRRLIIFTSFLYLTVTHSACRSDHKRITRGFYFWKTDWRLTEDEKNRIDEEQISRFFLRFFDVVKNGDSIVPVAKLSMHDSLPTDVVPVIFITNKIFPGTDSVAIDNLAEKMVKLVTTMARNAGARFHQLQLDCDWTLQSRQLYFR